MLCSVFGSKQVENFEKHQNLTFSLPNRMLLELTLLVLDLHETYILKNSGREMQKKN